MTKAEYDVVGIFVWTLVLGLTLPLEWCQALYRSPFGRVWEGLVRVMDRAWSVLVRLIARTK